MLYSWFSWVVNQEGYGMVDSSTDWIVCSLNVGAYESDEGLVFLTPLLSMLRTHSRKTLKFQPESKQIKMFLFFLITLWDLPFTLHVVIFRPKNWFFQQKLLNLDIQSSHYTNYKVKIGLKILSCVSPATAPIEGKACLEPICPTHKAIEENTHNGTPLTFICIKARCSMPKIRHNSYKYISNLLSTNTGSITVYNINI